MILTFVNWSCIAAAAFISGVALSCVSKKIFGYAVGSIDGIIIAGIAVLTVYAEIFSLFAGVALHAVIVLGVLLAAALFICRKEALGCLKDMINSRHFAENLALLMLLAALLTIISASEPKEYDTYLYHIQSIEWIEKYGAVKGLANLHTRFGYDSAFMCLQALFSWSFIGRSLHGMNGFICLIMLQYAMADNAFFEKRRLNGADILKGAIIIYASSKYMSISSSGSDILPMMLVLYIMAKWTDIYQKGCREPEPYGLLSLLALYGLTVKLSIAPVVLLVLYPASLLVKNRKGKETIGFIISGVGVLAPYLIRNVILSGYLIYPLESIDLFNVDWKVPASISEADRLQISLYSKNMQDTGITSFSFREWVQQWYIGLTLMQKLFFTIALAACAAALCYIAYSMIHRVNSMQVFLIVISMLSFGYWFMTAPALRYGIVFLWLLPCVLAGWMKNDNIRYVFAAWMLIVMLSSMVGILQHYPTDTVNLVYPADYTSYKCHETKLLDKDGNAHTVWIPDKGDQSGYDVFPETPYNQEKSVELRGSSLAQGFRAIQ